MYDELSEADIQKMKEEIEHRKVLSVKRHWRLSRKPGNREISVKISSIRQPREKKTETKAESAILKEWSRQQKSSRIIPRMMRSD